MRSPPRSFSRSQESEWWPSRVPSLACRISSGSLGLLVSAGYLFAAAGALWLGRKERLPARRPIIVFTTIHAVVLSIGAYTSFGGSTGQDQIAPLISLFGLIHFESIIFALGNAAFVLALAKERSVAASSIAASTDPLTGILNRVAFMERAGQIVERSRRDSAPVSVMMFDLDRFKAVNDTHGHPVGDAVIRKFCEVPRLRCGRTMYSAG